MNRKIRMIITVIALFFILAPLISAEEPINDGIVEKSGAGSLYDVLDKDTKSYLEEVGIDSPVADTNGDINDYIELFSGMLHDKFTFPAKTLAAILIIIVICKLCIGMGNTKITPTVNMIGGLASAAMVLSPIIGLISSTKNLAGVASVFLTACIPVYTGLMIASGSAAAGASYSYTALLTGNLIPVISNVFIIPMLNIFLAFAVTSSVTSVNLTKATDSIYKLLKWLLLLIVTVFTAVISLQTFLSSNIDIVSAKTAKVVASSFLPIVGGVIGDSLAAIQGSINIIKSGVGAFGIIASLIIFLPTIIESVLWIAICSICEIAADLFEMESISRFMKIGTLMAKMILAVLASILVVCIVCGSIVVFTRGTS